MTAIVAKNTAKRQKCGVYRGKKIVDMTAIVAKNTAKRQKSEKTAK
jgi:hypothetical protein